MLPRLILIPLSTLLVDTIFAQVTEPITAPHSSDGGCALLSDQHIYCYGGTLKTVFNYPLRNVLLSLDISSYNYNVPAFPWYQVTSASDQLPANTCLNMISIGNGTKFLVQEPTKLHGPASPILIGNPSSNEYANISFPDSGNDGFYAPRVMSSVVDLSSTGKSIVWMFGGTLEGNLSSAAPSNIILFDYITTRRNVPKTTYFFIYGGMAFYGNKTVKDPAYLLDYSKNSITPVEFGQDNPGPGPLYHHAAVYVYDKNSSSNFIFVLWGSGENLAASDKVNILNCTDLKKMYWVKNATVTPNTGHALTPGEISGIAVGSVAGSFILSGLAVFYVLRVKKRKQDFHLHKTDPRRHDFDAAIFTSADASTVKQSTDHTDPSDDGCLAKPTISDYKEDQFIKPATSLTADGIFAKPTISNYDEGLIVKPATSAYSDSQFSKPAANDFDGDPFVKPSASHYSQDHFIKPAACHADVDHFAKPGAIQPDHGLLAKDRSDMIANTAVPVDEDKQNVITKPFGNS
ncbi:hypothetical protein DM01DRAFT_1390400 [Hesseltinella vesiculosa]|uniref:Galactose oxidase n=1 Tax=Hesseltinella vesiculosa TaxID=101127 RepID=A0A1X2GIY8_9FUNG|nr:hypothetical protein DM01DRAFT_1390400 [Hesseltinella vesiculosa]